MGSNCFGVWSFYVPVKDERLILGGAFLLAFLNLPLDVLIFNFHRNRRNVAERGRKTVVGPLGLIRICSAALAQFNDLGTTNLSVFEGESHYSFKPLNAFYSCWDYREFQAMLS